MRWGPGGHTTIYNTQNSPLRHNWINALREVRSGGERFLWIGTNGGAVRLKLSGGEPRWLVFDEKSGPARLPSNVIYRILDDARGRIYLASGRGIARLTPRPGDPNAYDVYTFTVRDGLPFGECNQAASLVDRAGRLWVGTSTAVAWLDPSAPEPKPGPSPLHVERITVDGRELAKAAHRCASARGRLKWSSSMPCSATSASRTPATGSSSWDGRTSPRTGSPIPCSGTRV